MDEEIRKIRQGSQELFDRALALEAYCQLSQSIEESIRLAGKLKQLVDRINLDPEVLVKM